MSNPLHAEFYADQAQQLDVEIVENQRIATDTYRLRFACPQIARIILPGQFLMLRLAHCNDPLIGRPLALYDVVRNDAGEAFAIDVVYLVKGKLTSELQHASPGKQMVVWGPLGNGFPPEPVDHLIMVAGGIGQTPFVALAKEYLGRDHFGSPARRISPSARQVTLCYGARRADLLAGVEDFRRIGVEVKIATDDGSAGHHGLVTEVLEDVLEDDDLNHRVVCCGPEPMMEAVAGVCFRAGTACQVSLETPMACGIGICFTCVAEIRDEQGQCDYRRTCVEGPVFDATSVVW